MVVVAKTEILRWFCAGMESRVKPSRRYVRARGLNPLRMTQETTFEKPCASTHWIDKPRPLWYIQKYHRCMFTKE